jgi:hypothetical protein
VLDPSRLVFCLAVASRIVDGDLDMAMHRAPAASRCDFGIGMAILASAGLRDGANGLRKVAAQLVVHFASAERRVDGEFDLTEASEAIAESVGRDSDKKGLDF